MFGWFFKPACPCDQAAKVWIEHRLEWLSDQFPRGAFRGGRIIEPTQEYFPEPYDGTDDAVLALLERVCGYMGVAPASVRLKLVQADRALGLVNGGGQAVPEGPPAPSRADRGGTSSASSARSSAASATWSGRWRTSWRTFGCWARAA